jgi:16S rRNA (guanine527-N7)-methyltransferase
MDGGRANQRPKCETSPTPGAAPRRDGTQTHRRRAIPIEREPLPTRVRDTPALPAAYDAALDRGLDALGLTMSPGGRAAIEGHVRLLLAWTKAINLTAIRDPEAVATAHVVDSLTGVAILRDLGAERFLDLGSGGGFPGVPLVAALDGTTARLVEPIGKKATFLTTALAATGLGERIAVDHARIEALAADPRQRQSWPAITARAVASTAELVELAFPLLARGGALIAWKRGDLALELAAARRAMQALGGGTIEVLPVSVPGGGDGGPDGASSALAGHALVVARPSGAVPAAYPRDPAARRRRPW